MSSPSCSAMSISPDFSAIEISPEVPERLDLAGREHLPPSPSLLRSGRKEDTSFKLSPYIAIRHAEEDAKRKQQRLEALRGRCIMLNREFIQHAVTTQKPFSEGAHCKVYMAYFPLYSGKFHRRVAIKVAKLSSEYFFPDRYTRSEETDFYYNSTTQYMGLEHQLLNKLGERTLYAKGYPLPSRSYGISEILNPEDSRVEAVALLMEGFSTWTLDSVIRIAHDMRKFIKIEVIRSIAYKIIHALRVLKEERIIHGDLNPPNITFDPYEEFEFDAEEGKSTLMEVLSTRNLKVIDLGSSVEMSPGEEEFITGDRLYTRMTYRAPEVAAASHGEGRISHASDMYSLGVTLLEMATVTSPLRIKPGEDGRIDERPLKGILETVLPRKIGDRIVLPSGFLRDIEAIQARYRTLNERIHIDQLCDFITRTMLLNPKDRITVEAALKHPFISVAEEDLPVARLPSRVDKAACTYPEAMRGSSIA